MLREKTQMAHIKIDLFQKARCPLNIIHNPNILHHNLNARCLLQNDLSQFIDEHHTTYEFDNQGLPILKKPPPNITLLQKTKSVTSFKI